MHNVINSMSKSTLELKNIIEAALLVADSPLSTSKLLALFPRDAQPSRDEIQAVINELCQDYQDRGVEIMKIGNAYRFQSCERYAPWLQRLSDSRPPRYSRALLETLSIIAYRQPVTRGDIEDIRGVSVSSDTIRTLLNREWIRQVGHRDVPGRPGLFGTTQQFLEYFNLKSLSELPILIEKRDLDEIARDMNLELPIDLEPPPQIAELDSESPDHSMGQEFQDDPMTQDFAEAEPVSAGASSTMGD